MSLRCNFQETLRKQSSFSNVSVDPPLESYTVDSSLVFRASFFTPVRDIRTRKNTRGYCLSENSRRRTFPPEDILFRSYFLKESSSFRMVINRIRVPFPHPLQKYYQSRFVLTIFCLNCVKRISLMIASIFNKSRCSSRELGSPEKFSLILACSYALSSAEVSFLAHPLRRTVSLLNHRTPFCTPRRSWFSDENFSSLDNFPGSLTTLSEPTIAQTDVK